MSPSSIKKPLGRFFFCLCLLKKINMYMDRALLSRKHVSNSTFYVYTFPYCIHQLPPFHFHFLNANVVKVGVGVGSGLCQKESSEEEFFSLLFGNLCVDGRKSFPLHLIVNVGEKCA